MNVKSEKSYPDQPGTKLYANPYGARLICVRYRYDAQNHKRFKTVELIVQESAWTPPPTKPDNWLACALNGMNWSYSAK